MRILFITPYPYGKAPSQRFRFEQYLQELTDQGWSYNISPFVDDAAWEVLYANGHLLRKFTGIVRGYWRRFINLIFLFRFDIVFIHREASPFGPPLIEWFITKVFRKYTVYDFDDAIWVPNASESNRLTHLFKRFSNPASICKWASVISAGNDFLADYARKYNANVVVNPTTIDTDEYHNKLAEHSAGKFIIGWTGSHSTVQYLDILLPVFHKLEEHFDFELRVICDTPPKFSLRSLRFIPWKKETEIDDLLGMHVGIMPLPDDIWTKGKCGFKALQYLSLGIPAIVSDVGVNPKIVDQDKNGCICRTTDEWYQALSRFMSDPKYLHSLRSHAREKVVNEFSVRSNQRNFLSLFRFGK